MEKDHERSLNKKKEEFRQLEESLRRMEDVRLIFLYKKILWKRFAR